MTSMSINIEKVIPEPLFQLIDIETGRQLAPGSICEMTCPGPLQGNFVELKEIYSPCALYPRGRIKTVCGLTVYEPKFLQGIFI